MLRPLVSLNLFLGLSLGLPSSGIGQGLPVYHVQLAGSLSEESFVMIERAIEEAQVAGGAALVLEFDLDSDEVQLAQEVAAMIVEAPIPVFAFVNPTALNAGALLALATDSIYMSPAAMLGGNDGAALPPVVTQDAEEVSVADLFGEYAEAHGVDRLVGVAMVDPTIEHSGLGEPGSRVALTTGQALELGLAVAEASTLEVLLEQIELAGSRVNTVDENWLATTITVDNNNWRDINIFVVLSGGMRMRLGTVTSMNSSTYTVPGNLLFRNSYMRVVAEVIGSDDYIQTETVRVAPGLVIQWRIENVLQNSNYFVWIRS